MPVLPTRKKAPREKLTPLLVSYMFLNEFLKKRNTEDYRDWVMDSGAFSAFNSGKTIDLNAYIDKCLELMETDKTLVGIFALDVIGDAEASMKNTEKMTDAGVPAIPCFHNGSPWHYLEAMAKQFPKIALGGIGLRGEHGPLLHISKKIAYVENYFSRVWPKWVHGFACADMKLLARVPFASVDSTSWLYGTARYGRYQAFRSFGQNIVPKRTEDESAYLAGVRGQISWHMELEDDTRRKFGKVLDRYGFGPFNLRLASDGAAMEHIAYYKQLILSQEK